MIEMGEAYYVWDEPMPTKHAISLSDEPIPEDVSFDTQTVYRPVYVDQTEDGERYAYYYDTDAEPKRILKDGGKEYVPTQHVHSSPPDDAIPYYKFKQKMKDEGRIPPWE